MARPLVSNSLWTQIETLLPAPKPRRLRYPGRKPQDRRAVFRVGVEIGHQLVVLPLFGTLAFARHKQRGTSRASLLPYISAMISSCGAYYLVVALHEQFFSR